MGFVLTILYFVTNYLTPPTLFGPLAAYRIELILALLILLVSLPKLIGTSILKTPQSLAVAGLAIAASFSVLIAYRWPMGAVHGFLGFIPNAFAFLLVSLHCNSKRKLQVMVLMLLSVCLFVIAHGYSDLRRAVTETAPSQSDSAEGDNEAAWNLEHPYLTRENNDKGKLIYRIKGLGSINDPNDFGQVVICVIPLMFILWRAKKMFQNIAFVILPVCALLIGVFLTHSRGALLALIAMVIVAARRRIGTVPALLLAGGLFISAMALHFTGDRQISAEAGSDRTSLWGEGLQILKAHPLFGVGYGNMSEFTDNHRTAHNSLVVCAVELGLFGFYFWSLFLFTTSRDALAIASPIKVTEGEPIVPEEALFPQAARKVETLDKAEVNRLGRLLVVSLTGFLVAGWFLSNAYVMMFFLLGGMIEATYQMAFERGMIAPRLPLARTLAYAGGLAISLLLIMYILLRTVNLTQAL
jgi:O-antigen ligase